MIQYNNCLLYTSKLREAELRIILTTDQMLSMLKVQVYGKQLRLMLLFHVPVSYTHLSQCNEQELAEQGIKPNTIRLSIGTENIDDLIAALDDAFNAVD